MEIIIFILIIGFILKIIKAIIMGTSPANSVNSKFPKKPLNPKFFAQDEKQILKEQKQKYDDRNNWPEYKFKNLRYRAFRDIIFLTF